MLWQTNQCNYDYWVQKRSPHKSSNFDSTEYNTSNGNDDIDASKVFKEACETVYIKTLSVQI